MIFAILLGVVVLALAIALPYRFVQAALSANKEFTAQRSEYRVITNADAPVKEEDIIHLLTSGDPETGKPCVYRMKLHWIYCFSLGRGVYGSLGFALAVAVVLGLVIDASLLGIIHLGLPHFPHPKLKVYPSPARTSGVLSPSAPGEVVPSLHAPSGGAAQTFLGTLPWLAALGVSAVIFVRYQIRPLLPIEIDGDSIVARFKVASNEVQTLALQDIDDIRAKSNWLAQFLGIPSGDITADSPGTTVNQDLRFVPYPQRVSRICKRVRLINSPQQRAMRAAEETAGTLRWLKGNVERQMRGE